MIRGEISEYPYYGVITRIVEGAGMQEDTELTIYEGAMDVHLQTAEEGKLMQTSSYIISIPFDDGSNGSWILPRKGDKVTTTWYNEETDFVIDNVIPSQLGGVSIYATRNSWY